MSSNHDIQPAPLLAINYDESKADIVDDAKETFVVDQDDAGQVSYRFSFIFVFAKQQWLRSYDVDAIAARATEADYKRLVRKIDRVILPLLFGTYTLQCIDKSTLGYASVFTLISDLGLKGKE